MAEINTSFLDSLSDKDLIFVRDYIDSHLHKPDDTKRKLFKRDVSTCPECGKHNIVKNGTRDGVQRYFCKDCRHFFSDHTGIIMDHSRIILADGTQPSVLPKALQAVNRLWQHIMPFSVTEGKAHPSRRFPGVSSLLMTFISSVPLKRNGTPLERNCRSVYPDYARVILNYCESSQ